MDLVCEYLVKKKSQKDDLTRLGLTVACVLLCILVFYIGFFLFHAIIGIVPLLMAGIIYGTVILRRNYSLEYEYVFVNGVLDIDVIKGKARRSRLISVPCRKIDYMGPVTRIKPTQNKVVNTMYDETRPGKYVITFSDGGVKTDLYLQPPEKLLLHMQKYNPGNIHIDE